MAYPQQPSAMDEYGYPVPHQQQQQAMGPQAMGGPVPGQTYHSADGTQAYCIDEYGRETYWQLPPAPRMSSAAARSWNNYYSAQRERQFADAQSYAPWAAYSRTATPPGTAHHHAEIEHQMMLHHQLSKLQGLQQQPPQASQPHSYAPSLEQQALHHGHHAARASQYPVQPSWPAYQQQHVPMQQTTSSSSHQGYDPHARHQSQPALGPQHQGWTEQHSACDRFGTGPATAYDPHQSQLDAYQQPIPGVYGASAVYAPQQQANGWYAEQHNASHYPQQQQAPGFPPPSRSRDQVNGGAAAQQWPSWQGPRRSEPSLVRGDYYHYPRQHQHRASSSHSRRRSGQWEQQQQQQHGAHEAQQREHRHHSGPEVSSQASAAPPPPLQVETSAAAEDKGPAPPSPDTLDRSGVPLSAFGAEIVWHACAVLLEPGLLAQAHSSDESSSSGDGMTSPSSSSSLSSPMLSTPANTSSPSFDQKDSDAPARLLSSMGLTHYDVDNRIGARGGQQDIESSWRRDSSVDVRRNNSGSAASSSDGKDDDHHRAVLRSPVRLASPGTAAPPRGPVSEKGSRASKTQERSRSVALSVLSLVSPRWTWTQAQAALPSLVEMAERGAAEASAASFSSSPLAPARHHLKGPRTPTSPRDVGPLFPNNSAAEVSPAFRRFTHQVLAQTLLSPTAFLLSLLYALRVPLLAIDANGNLDPEAMEVFASPPSAAPFKLFTLGLMIANKHLDDNTFLNKTWNEVTGIPLQELNKMEQFYLIRCNFEVALPDRLWLAFLGRLKSREERRLEVSLQQQHQQQQRTGRGSTPRRSSTSSDGASRRVLHVIDDIFTHYGSIEPLDLSQSSSRDSSDLSMAPPATSDTSFSTTGDRFVHHRAVAAREPRNAALGQERQQQQRPQCRSAPASAFKLQGLSATYIDEEEDGNEDAKAMPNSAPASRPTLDGFARSLSDGISGSHTSNAHEAPLAPSALLELLNSGRSLASAH